MLGSLRKRLVRLGALPPRLFVSYRSADRPAEAQLVALRVRELLPRSRVAIDVEIIRLGEDWREPVARAIARADVFLLAVGPRWQASDLARQGDPVAFELGIARERGLPIVPLFLGVDRFPRPDGAPANLLPVFEINGTSIRTRQSGLDVRDMLAKLGLRRFEERAGPSLLLGATGGFVSVLAGYLVYVLVYDKAIGRWLGNEWTVAGLACGAALGAGIALARRRWGLAGDTQDPSGAASSSGRR